MKQEQAKVGNDCGEELADNLPNVLQLLSMIEDEDFLEELVVKIIIPAIEKMIYEFDSARMKLKAKVLKKKHKVMIQEGLVGGNIYKGCFNAIESVLTKDYAHVEPEVLEVKPTFGGNFLTNCDSCSDTETTKQTEKTEVK